ncbi:MAG: polymerase, sigma-24 subunit, subfamily [Nocardioidaceae bacterium]|nr:polymerase, sigma-24 subunit, subfamily [Nocardioidaceae bacterium]
MSSSDDVAFGEARDRDGPRVAAYVRRHVPPDDVQDVVAETFLHAWRRWDAVPQPPIGWLIGTARKVIGNSRRNVRRRSALHDRLVLLGSAARSSEDAGMLATERLAALEALAALPDQQREALLLVSWDGLTPDEAASALGVRPGTFRVRAHRARKALDDATTSDRLASAAGRPLTEGGPMTTHSTLTALAPDPRPFDPAWSQATLAGILAADRVAVSRRRKGRRRTLVAVAAAFLTVSTATAVAVGGPGEVVKRVLTDFGNEPNTSGNNLGVLHDPLLVAQFPTQNGIFAFWVVTSSSGGVCYAMSDGQWDGVGSPTKDQLSYGCGGQLFAGPHRPSEELTRVDQLGGFFKDTDGPLVYGVSAYPDAATVRVQGAGVDRTLPVRPDSRGYGAALPEAANARAVTLTFLGVDGQVLGSKRVVAPVG